MSNKNNRASQHKRLLFLTQLAVLTAIMLLLELSGLGMIKIGPLEMTILTVPVIIGAIVMGPLGGTLLGVFFGLISFWECFGKSAFGATLLGINPVYTFLVCVPTRTLMGFLCAWIFRGLKKVDKTQFLSYCGASLSGALLNTLFFMSVLMICFGNTGYIQDFMTMLGTQNVFLFVILFIGVQGLVEALLCAFLGTVVSKAVDIAVNRRS